MKKIISVVLIALMVLGGCASPYESAVKTIDKYNAELEIYNGKISEYNSVAKARNESIKLLSEELASAKAAVELNEAALDENTLTVLNEYMEKGEAALVEEVEVLPEFNRLTVSENMTDEELKTLKKQANDDMKTMKNVKVPEAVEAVDYSDILPQLIQAHKDYETSVQALKQITAPTDEFVMERLKQIDTIVRMEPATEDNDPNNHLHKPGGYTGQIYFRDSRISLDKLVIYDQEESVIDMGTDCGGSIEIYPDRDSAEKRSSYLAVLDGTFLDSGSHEVYGTILIRTSRHLTATQQKELTQKILEVLTYVAE